VGDVDANRQTRRTVTTLGPVSEQPTTTKPLFDKARINRRIDKVGRRRHLGSGKVLRQIAARVLCSGVELQHIDRWFGRMAHTIPLWRYACLRRKKTRLV